MRDITGAPAATPDGSFRLHPGKAGHLSALYVELRANVPGVPPPARGAGRPGAALMAVGCTDRGVAVDNEHFVCGNRVATPDGQLALTGSGRLTVTLATAPPILHKVVVLVRPAGPGGLAEGTTVTLCVLCQLGAEQVTHVARVGPLAAGQAVEVGEIRRAGRGWEFGPCPDGRPAAMTDLARAYRILLD